MSTKNVWKLSAWTDLMHSVTSSKHCSVASEVLVFLSIQLLDFIFTLFLPHNWCERYQDLVQLSSTRITRY